MGQSELVSVVVPAYNAEATLAATLESVHRQTYDNLEIIVVDDGSTDGTLALAEAMARRDGRIRALSKPNGGVGAARNAGVRASRGAYLAPVDADDLWHPDKIARQMAAMAAGGPEMGFVYTGFRHIDTEGRAVATPPRRFMLSGRMFLRHILVNPIGNGSSLLIRRAAFDAVGGYATDRRAQGCADHLLQILIARFWIVGVVADYLTGYRMHGAAMSANRERMAEAALLLLDHVRARHPETPEDVLATAEAHIRSRRAVFQLLGERRVAAAASNFRRALRRSPGVAMAVGGLAFREHVQGVVERRLLSPGRAEPVAFFDMDPAVEAAGPFRHPLEPWVRALEPRDEAFFRSGRSRAATAGEAAAEAGGQGVDAARGEPREAAQP
jgi:glycosyltransferase involved in cell wall biosynthesis